MGGRFGGEYGGFKWVKMRGVSLEWLILVGWVQIWDGMLGSVDIIGVGEC